MIEVASFVARKSVIEVTGFVESSSPKSSPQGSGLDDASFLRLAIWSPQIILSGTWLVESTSLNWSPVPLLKPFQLIPHTCPIYSKLGKSLKWHFTLYILVKECDWRPVQGSALHKPGST